MNHCTYFNDTKYHSDHLLHSTAQAVVTNNPMFCVNFAGATRQVETAGAARHSCVAKVKIK